MNPIANVDGLVLLLRQRLLDRSKSTSMAAHKRRAAVGSPLGGREMVQALAALESVDDRQLKRALVQNLLTEQLGPALLNDAKFQQVVDRVTETIEADADGSALLTRIAGEMRASAG